MSNRKCAKCDEVKDKSEFYMRGKYLSSYCKPCDYIKSREWIMKNRDKVRVWGAIGQSKHRKKNPEKHTARQFVHLHRDIIIKDKCQVCDSNDNLIAHHPDYSDKFNVITLCNECHIKTHRKLAYV